VADSVEDLRNAGIANGKPAVIIIIFRQPNANIVGTVDQVMAELPALRASISPAIDVEPMVDRSTTIRASLAEVERTLLISAVATPFLNCSNVFTDRSKLARALQRCTRASRGAKRQTADPAAV
jgi:hypothetical protein